MNFLRMELLAPIIIIFLIYSVVYWRSLKKTDRFVGDTWFLAPGKFQYLRRVFYLTGIALVLFSLLDPRGPEQRVESRVPDQKTIIIIDSSASMLAEDVRPNRYKKAVLMARHFIKKAFGHKIAVVLFSDTQKRLVPFTDDLDLLDARVAGLEDLDLYDGGSNITQAINESVGYFKINSGNSENVGGNILVFTDSEGHDEDMNLKLPEKVTLGVVGVGTAKGARIPNRDRYGVFRGYKQYKGEEVVSKLNEDWLKSLNSEVEYYKYWVANSYTIPTEEILQFFNKTFAKKLNKGSATIRPVKVEIFLVPGIILLILSLITYPVRAFKAVSVVTLCVLSLVSSPSLKAEEDVQNKIIEKLKNKLASGKMDLREKMKFAEVLLRNNKPDAAAILYQETEKDLTPEDLNNYAVSLMKTKRPKEALGILSDLQKRARDGEINLSDSQRQELRQNVLLALQEQKRQQKQKQKEKEEEEKKKKQQQQQGEGKSGDKKGEKKQKSKGQKGEKKKKEKKKGKSEKDKENKKGKKKKKSAEQALKERQKQIKQKRNMVKVPGLIKQIMSDDRTLQKKYLDTATDKPRAFEKKDW